MKRSLVSIAVLIAGAVACDNAPTSHEYVALRYEPANDCLEPSAAIDTVDTGGGSLLCAPTCLVAAQAGGGEIVYVSTMCGPYPPEVTDTSGTDPSCIAALAAYANGCACGEDGGAACGADSSGPDGGDGSIPDASKRSDANDDEHDSSDGATDAPARG